MITTLRRTAALLAALALPAAAEVNNLKVVTDANPDYSDLPSLVNSATGNWQTPEQKCWAMFYWNHLARRQTNPIMLHGMALTDPIRQFNDYGYTMCSTISGINQSIWEQMGLPHRYWDISLHTVSEVFYDGRWHMYDNSLSALYTLCDGKTIAGVEDIGKDGACELSGGKVEKGHIAKYHCLTATSVHGFLSGADTIRPLEEETRCFNPAGLKLRKYFYDWDYGHRYILNLKPGEVYTRSYKGLGTQAGLYVPNDNGKDPEQKNPRYKLRGNGVWVFSPSLKPGEFEKVAHSFENVTPLPNGGLKLADATRPGFATFKVQSANVTTSQKIKAALALRGAGDKAKIAVSRDNGLHWKDAWAADKTGEPTADLTLIDEVNGAYEVLVKVELIPGTAPAAPSLKSLDIQTTTAINAKTQPRLNLGRNAVYVGAGEPTDSVVFWPELQGDKYKEMVVEEKNVKSADKHPGYMGTIHPAEAKEDAYVVYRVDAPRDLVKLTYGGRFYNRAPKSHIGLLHSFDGGKTWTKAWTLTDTRMPWDVIHYETVAVPPGVKSALVKYVMNTTEPKVSGCSIYAVRIEGNYKPVNPTPSPVEVTFTWSEVQKDRSLVKRSHTQVVDKLPATYEISTGGEDHPVMESLAVNLRGARGPVATGYSDGKDTPGRKWVGTWRTLGKNLAVGRKYTISHPSESNWGAGDPDGTRLTDGVAGPTYAGGLSYKQGALWKPRTNPVITVDLGEARACASFGLDFHGYPWWDALKGEVKDQVEVLVSDDGKAFESLGLLQTDLRNKDVPYNFMVPDDEALAGGTFRLVPPQPVTARYVQYKVSNSRMFCATEIEVLDSFKLEPFDLKVALPK